MIWKVLCTGDLKSDHLESRLFEGQILNGRALVMYIVPTIQKPHHSKSGHFCPKFQMVGLPHSRSYLKSRPFATQPLLDHSKSRLGRISDPHCIQLTIELFFTFFHFFYHSTYLIIDGTFEIIWGNEFLGRGRGWGNEFFGGTWQRGLLGQGQNRWITLRTRQIR